MFIPFVFWAQIQFSLIDQIHVKDEQILPCSSDETLTFAIFVCNKIEFNCDCLIKARGRRPQHDVAALPHQSWDGERLSKCCTFTSLPEISFSFLLNNRMSAATCVVPAKWRKSACLKPHQIQNPTGTLLKWPLIFWLQLIYMFVCFLLLLVLLDYK